MLLKNRATCTRRKNAYNQVCKRGTWHDTEHGYLWMLVGMDLNPVASVTVLLTETWYLLDLWT